MKKSDAQSKKIGAFLKDLDACEFRQLELTMSMVVNMRYLIKEHKLTKKRFCHLFDVSLTRYEDYVSGNWSYALSDMAKLNAIYYELEAEKLENNPPIDVADAKK